MRRFAMNYLSKKSLRRLALVPFAVLVAGLAMVGCYEDFGLTVKDFDTYTTKYMPGANFQNYKYFIKPDTIMHIIDPGPIDPLAGARKYDRQILDLTISNLQARGYIPLDDTSQITSLGIDPDSVLAVLMGQFSVEHSGYYYDYWYGYWGGYYPGWGYGGYYPPTYVSTYEYTVGTNVTEIIDYGKSKAQQKYAPVWVGIITGLTGEPSTAQNRIATGVNRTFEQSPYMYAGQ
jgi:hypothetical protein